MALKPLSDRVIIRRLEESNTSAGGIVLPDSAKEKPAMGEVIAVGSGKKGVALELKVGDKVLFGKYAGQEISYEAEDLLVMKEEDVIAKI